MLSGNKVTGYILRAAKTNGIWRLARLMPYGQFNDIFFVLIVRRASHNNSCPVWKIRPSRFCFVISFSTTINMSSNVILFHAWNVLSFTLTTHGLCGELFSLLFIRFKFAHREMPGMGGRRTEHKHVHIPSNKHINTNENRKTYKKKPFLLLFSIFFLLLILLLRLPLRLLLLQFFISFPLSCFAQPIRLAPCLLSWLHTTYVVFVNFVVVRILASLSLVHIATGTFSNDKYTK